MTQRKIVKLIEILFAVLYASLAMGALAADDSEATDGRKQTQKEEQVQKNDRATAEQATVLPEMTVTASPVDEPSYQETTSTVGTKFEAPIEAIPQGIQVINRSTIEDQGAITVGDALKNVPSVSPAPSRLSPIQSSYKIRGFRARVTTNGFRHQFFDDVDASRLGNVERIEVLKGPGATLFGQTGLGGTINLVSKQPQDRFQGEIYGIVGEDDRHAGGFDVTGPLASGRALKGRLNAEIERSGSFVDLQGIDRDNAALSLAWDDGGPLRAFVLAEHVDRRSQINAGLPVIGTLVSNGVGEIPRSTFLGEPDAKTDDKGLLVQSRVDYDLNRDWTLSVGGQYANFDDEQTAVIAFVDPALDPSLTTATRFANTNSESDHDYTTQMDLTGKFKTGSLGHHTLLGWEYNNHQSRAAHLNFDNFPSIDVLNPIHLQSLPQPVPGPEGTFPIITHAGYFQDLVALTPRLDFLGGVRYTTIDSSTTGTFGPPTDLKTDKVTYQVGAAYRVFEPVSIFAGYAQGIDPLAVQGSQSFNGTAFKPEESDQIETGIKLNFPWGLTGTVSYFDLTRTNVTTRDPDPEHIGFSVQTGEERSRGAEVDLAWQVTDAWFMRGGYAYMDAEITKSNAGDQGHRPTDVPKNLTQFWTYYRFKGGPLKNLSLGAGVYHVGARPNDNANSINLPAYTTLDLSAAYQWKNVRAELFLQNLTDEEYFTTLGIDGVVFAGDPRQIFGRLRVSF